MKKRLFRNLLILGLLLIALTAAASAATFRGQFYSDALPQGKTPVTEIRMTATFYCNQCKSTDTTITPIPTVNLTGIQYPVNNNYQQMALTVNISEFTCTGCNHKIGPIQNLSVTCTTTVQNGYFCHTGQTADPLKASSSPIAIGSDKITFAIETTPNYKLKQCSPRPATCAQVGIKAGVNCKHCDGCGKYFDSNTDEEILANQVEIPMLKHDYNSETGKCNVCQAQAPAHLGNQFYATFAEALTAYNTSGGTLTAYSLPENTTIDLKKSGKLVINSGATASKITMSDGLTVTIENAGTISSIKMSESSALTINNSGTVGSVEMDKPGTLTIDNSSTITSIKTPVEITGTGTRTINITNHSNSVIDKIEAPNTTITVQNDGKIGELIGYFHPDDDDTSRVNMVTLARGSGIYKKISSVKPDPFVNSRWTSATADFSKLLLTDDYFYFVKPETFSGEDKYWYRDGYRLTYYAMTLTDVYFTCYPFSSIEVTGEAGNSAPVKLTPDEKGRLTMTVDARQDVMLTGDVVLPAHGLNSKQNQLTYRWSSNAPGGSGSGNVFKFEDILYGEYDLTLTVTDNEYHHSKSVNIHINATKPADEKIEIFLKTPKPSYGDVFTKSYDGTIDPPSGLEIEFYVKNSSGYERTIPVSSDCYDAVIAYKDKNCSDNNPITVTVELTETGTQNYTLGENGTATYTVPGKITQTDTTYTISPTAEAHVGDSVFQSLTFNGIWWCRTEPRSLFNPVTPGTTIMVEDEPLSVTFYRLHPSNITSAVRDDDIQFISDPEIDEPLSKDSVFKYAGKYYIYAVVQPTTNYKGKITNCRVINVQDTEASSNHHTNYNGGWDGMTTVPIKAGEEKSFYLSGSYSTIYTELLLSQGKNLTLCLNGKTLSATKSITSYDQIRVTGGAELTIDDCTETGTAKGTVVSSGTGGIAYVQNGTITIRKGKFTGGTAKTGGGAIVVDKDGVLTIFGGEISGNTVTSGKGGAIYIKSGGVVNMYGGKIQNNHVYSGNGGAIYVEKGGTLNLYGGEITGNTASGLGGGIYVEAGGTLKIQGNPVVTGNTAGGKANNVYVRVDSTSPLLTISGAMTSGAQLGISTDASYPALLALTQQDHSAYFTPDAPDTFVVFSGSALTLCAKPSATLEGSTLTVKTGGNYMDNTVLLFVAEYGADGRLLTAQSQAVKPETPDYTFKVSSNKIKCFLLNAQTYTPLMEAFVFN